MGGFDDRECQLLGTLLSTSDEITKHRAIRSLAGIGRLRQRWAIDSAIAVDIGNSTALAEALAEIFDTSWGIPPESLNEADIESVLAKFETVGQVEGFELSQFLSYAAKRLPQAVIRLVLARIDRDAANHNREYRPLPYSGFHEDLSGVIESSEYRRFCERFAIAPSARAGHYISGCQNYLFRYPTAWQICLRVLNEWIDSGEEGKVEAAAALVSDAHPNFVFSEGDFVNNLLNRANTIGQECYGRVCLHLRNSANGEVRTSAIGTPAPQDIAVRDQARQAAAKLVAGSPAHRFYEDLANEAEASIRNGLARDEELLT